MRNCGLICHFIFKGGNADELDLTEGEFLEIISDGDGDGWVRAQNSNGKLGFIPQNYIEFLDNNTDSMSRTDSVKSGGYSHIHESSIDATNVGVVTSQNIPTVEVHSPVTANDMAQEVTSYSSGDIEVQMTTDSMSPDQESLPPPPNGMCSGIPRIGKSKDNYIKR